MIHVGGKGKRLPLEDREWRIAAGFRDRGGEARLLATGLGDGDDGVEALSAIGGAAMRPPSPAHFRGERLAGGDLRLSWVRRGRAGWNWSDGSDIPLGEETEAYMLTLTGAGFERRVLLAEPSFLYSAADQAADGAPAA